MKLTHIFAAMVMLAVGGALAQSAEQNVADLISEFQGESAAKERSPEQLMGAYNAVLDSLMPKMGSENVAEQKEPQQALQTMAWRAGRPNAEAERAAISSAIAGRLGQANSTAQMWLLKQLEFIGRAEAVSAVAKLLEAQDPHVRDCARRALENNPSAEAGEALRKALGSAAGPWRIALINAVAFRRDAASVPALIKDAASDDDELRSAAVVALAEIGDKSGASAISSAMTKGSPVAQSTATDACLGLAGRLAQSDKAAALAIYEPLLKSSGHVRCAALVGLGRAGSVGELPTLFNALTDEYADVRGAAIEALSVMPGRDVTAVIARKIEDVPSAVRLGLVRALAARNEKSSFQMVLACLSDPDSAVQVEAARALATLGNARCVPSLARAAASGGELQTVARNALDTLTGDGVDDALVAVLSREQGAPAAEAARSLAARRSTSATAALLQGAASADAAVRSESLRALAAVGDASAVAQLVSLTVNAANDQDRDQASAALIAAARRNPDVQHRADAVADAIGKAQGQTKLTLIRAVGRIGGDSALAAVQSAIQSQDAATRDAGVRALADWPDMTAGDALLALAGGNASPAQQVIALRGYLRLVSMPSDRPADQTVALYQKALAAAQRTEEKRQVIGALSDAKTFAALKVVEPFLGDESLKAEAASAAAKIGGAREVWDVRRDAAQVKAILVKAAAATTDAGVRKQAEDAIGRIDRRYGRQ